MPKLSLIYIDWILIYRRAAYLRPGTYASNRNINIISILSGEIYKLPTYNPIAYMPVRHISYLALYIPKPYMPARHISKQPIYIQY